MIFHWNILALAVSALDILVVPSTMFALAQPHSNVIFSGDSSRSPPFGSGRPRNIDQRGQGQTPTGNEYIEFSKSEEIPLEDKKMVFGGTRTAYSGEQATDDRRTRPMSNSADSTNSAILFNNAEDSPDIHLRPNPNEIPGAVGQGGHNTSGTTPTSAEELSPSPENPSIPSTLRPTVSDRLAVPTSVWKVAMALSKWRTSGPDGRDDQNVVISPLCIVTAMNLLLMGARGRTHTELWTALQLPRPIQNYVAGENILSVEGPTMRLNNDAIHQEMADILDSLNMTMSEKIAIISASAIFFRPNITLYADYSIQASKYYNTELLVVDFAHGMDPINEWIAYQTSDQIKRLITEPLDPLIEMLIVTAVYFKGSWEHVFDPMHTREITFNSGRGRKKSIPVMINIIDIPYAESRELNARAIALPYRGNLTEMIIILPNLVSPKVDALDALTTMESKLTVESLGRIVDSLRVRSVSLNLPRLHIEDRLNLVPAFRRFGVRSLFDPKSADLSKIGPIPGLFVNDILHQASVELTEFGTEAAAATAVSISRDGNSKSFRLDRPFIFIIHHVPTGTPLFWARVVDPEAASS